MAAPTSTARLRELLAALLSHRSLSSPGNHDDRDALAAAFPAHAYLPRAGRFIQYVFEGIPCGDRPRNSRAWPGRASARRGATGWLAARPRKRPRARRALHHHPPFVTESREWTPTSRKRVGVSGLIGPHRAGPAGSWCAVTSRVAHALVAAHSPRPPQHGAQVALDLRRTSLRSPMEPPALPASTSELRDRPGPPTRLTSVSSTDRTSGSPSARSASGKALRDAGTSLPRESLVHPHLAHLATESQAPLCCCLSAARSASDCLFMKPPVRVVCRCRRGPSRLVFFALNLNLPAHPVMAERGSRVDPDNTSVGSCLVPPGGE